MSYLEWILSCLVVVETTIILGTCWAYWYESNLK